MAQAFLLRPDGIDDFVLIDKPINVNLGTSDYSIEIKVALSVSINTYILGQDQSTQSNTLALLANGRMQITSGGSAAWFSNGGFILFDGLPHVYRVEHDSNGQMRFFRDQEPFQVRTYNANTVLPIPFNCLFRLSSSASAFSALDFYYLELTGFLNSARWDANDVSQGPEILVDKLGNNHGTLINFAADGSARVSYDDGSAGNEQILSTSGTLTSVQTGTAVTTAINEQALSVTGAVQAAQFGVANVAAVNEQALSLTGQLKAYTAGAADTVAINAQHQPLTGSLQLQSIASVSLSSINDQQLSVSGFTTAYSSGIAVLTAINDQAGEQTGSISGQLHAVTVGIASVQGVNDQNLQLTGTASAISQFAGYITPINEQQFSIEGETQAYSAGVAALQAINEQAGEQIGFITGQLIASHHALASLQSVNDQQGNISGITTTASSGRVVLQKINRGNIELAPHRMTAQRILPALLATRKTPTITVTRLTNNITAQRV